MGTKNSQELNFWKPEMAHDIILDPAYFWSTRIIDILSSTIILFVLMYHLYVLLTFDPEADKLGRKDSDTSELDKSRTVTGLTTRRGSALSAFSRRGTASTRSRRNTMRSASMRAQHKRTARWTAINNIFSVLFILCSLVTITTLTLNIFLVWPAISAEDCGTNVVVLCTAYHLSKALFYSILLARLQVAFGSSPLGYANWKIYTMYGFVSIYTIFVVFGTPYMIEGAALGDGNGDLISNERPWCHVHIKEDLGTASDVGLLAWILMDMIISITLLYAFKRPIDKLLEIMSKKCLKLSGLVMKSLILCWISIILNLISLILYVWRHVATVIEMNLPILCICVVFMHVSYDKQFKLVCKPCVKCYQKWFLDAKDKAELEIHARIQMKTEMQKPSRAASGSVDVEGTLDRCDTMDDSELRSPSMDLNGSSSPRVSSPSMDMTDENCNPPNKKHLSVVAEGSEANLVDDEELELAIDAAGSSASPTMVMTPVDSVESTTPLPSAHAPDLDPDAGTEETNGAHDI